MNIHLKVKIASLAAEARIIRRYENRLLKKLRKIPNWPDEGKPDEIRAFGTLRYHRKWDVRREARSSCLAYGFLRGRSYKALEKTCRHSPDWKRVESIINSFSVGDKRDVAQRFSEWKSQE